MTTVPAASDRLTDQPSAARIPVLDLLRGLAALAVCLYHFTDPRDGLFAAGDPLRLMTWQGWLGVEVFFVISGFVIPYSMYLRSYRLRDAGGFLVRRLKRLEPPYLACILLILLLNGLWMIIPSMSYRAQNVTAPQILVHLGYLNSVLKSFSARWDYEWLNPVFWTLAIEFQFYIFMAIVMPLLMHKRTSVRAASTLAIALVGWLGAGETALLPHWLPLFAIGIVTFQSYAGLLPARGDVVLMSIIAALSWHIVGARQTIVGLVAALSIRLFARSELPRFMSPLLWLGAISYSLYLVHIPIGEPLIDWLAGYEGAHSQRYLITAAAIAASIGTAWVFWYAVERPSQSWARGSRNNKAERSTRAISPR